MNIFALANFRRYNDKKHKKKLNFSTIIARVIRYANYLNFAQKFCRQT